MEQSRLFTLEEANALLPQFSIWLKEIQECHSQITGVIHSHDELSKGNGNLLKTAFTINTDLKEVSIKLDRIRMLIDRIQVTGAEIKDLVQGIINFRHRRAGREVYLCWFLGEPTIRWWHNLEAGAAERQPL